MGNNPQRGCGTRHEDSFYIDSEMSSSGTLWPWTWILGDALDTVLAISAQARGVSLFNPAATIATGELIIPEDFEPADFLPGAADLYTRLCTRTRKVGILDHIGADNYSAWSFADEVQRLGPSRRINRQQAQVIARWVFQKGALPIVFTHARMPVFVSEEDMQEAIEIVTPLLDSPDWANKNYNPTWLHADWSMYTRSEDHDEYWGKDHFLIPILSIFGEWDLRRELHQHDECYREVGRLMRRLMFTEQIVGASWITRVTYILPRGSDKPAQDLENMPGVNIESLDDTEENHE